MLLKIDNVTAGLSKPFGKVYLLKSLDFSLQANDFVAIVGESGAGKSSFVNLIAGFLYIFKGKVVLDGYLYTKKMDWRKLATKRQIVPQHIENSFNPYYTLRHSLEEITHTHKISFSRVLELLELIDLEPDILDRLPRELSRGQLQRISILRSILFKPKLLVMDEPFTALDIVSKENVVSSLIKSKGNFDSLVITTHELDFVPDLVQRVYEMKKGKIVREILL